MAGRISISLLSALLLAVVAAPAARAEESSPVMFSLIDPVQWPSSQSDVGGFRLSLLYGECADFAGLTSGSSAARPAISGGSRLAART